MSEACYGHSSPNAVILPNYGPCNPQAGSVSLCCEIGQTCLTNGLCVTQSGVYYNGGCTDSTYKAAICPTFCTLGDANWVVECHGSAVKAGDFCCSDNGTTSTCCNNANNGLGLVAAVSSAQAVSATSVGSRIIPASISASTVPTSISSSDNFPSSGSIASSFTSTSSSIANTDSPNQPSSPDVQGKRKAKISVAVLLPLLVLVLLIYYFRRYIKFALQRLQRRYRPYRPRRTPVASRDSNDRRKGTDESGTQAQPTERGVIPTEVEGSEAAGEVEGSPVGPIEMDANQTRVAPTDPPPDGSATPDVAPDNNPLREPPATPGSWYDPNLGSL